MEIYYVTGNKGKYLSVKKYFEKYNVDVNFMEFDFEELEINDIEVISRQKVTDAYSILNKPCFVIDTGFYIDNYPNNPGYPGALVKRSGVANNIEKLLDIMKNVENRECRFVDCLTFYDGNNYYTFYGVRKGTLSTQIRGSEHREAKSNLWKLFIPNNYDKTLAEMSDEERNSNKDGYISVNEIFVKWYKDEYLNKKVKKLSY